MKNMFARAVLQSGILLLGFAATGCDARKTRFAVIGDYGFDTPAEGDVRDRVDTYRPDFVITTGDNNYDVGGADTIDPHIGKYWHSYIYPYLGSFGAGASGENRFFPVLGNHDWETASAKAYLDYFTLPGNERYYDFQKGPIHFFMIDSDPREPDGIDATSKQALWLKEQMQSSRAFYKLVVMHHPPYTSPSEHTSEPRLQWPFAEWGATAVLTGHNHTYERIEKDGLVYFVNGLGGRSLYAWQGAAIEGSRVRYNEDYGTMIVEADAKSMVFQFVTRTGEIKDTYEVKRSSAR